MVFLGDSFSFLKHEFGKTVLFLVDFADSLKFSFFFRYCRFSGFLSSFHPSNAWDFEDQVFGRIKTR
ncbi:uncharacterized protein OCT59_016271 [Rhizophagus irregularis]|uniref:uncharacterized protein n=1 Tax=Rhizophagus irregularis TaxID=588596 RepID=UPI003328D4F5|nr:hypothetical protein OCT59_016271 [Rhizophagus irregularis]